MGECVRILHTVGIMNRGGIENMIMQLYRNIDRSKIQFDFVVHNPQVADFDDEIRAMGGKIYYAPRYTVTNHIQYKKWWNDFFKFNKEYKIIHGHIYSVASIYLKIARKYGLVTISHSHSTSSGKGIKAMVQNLLQRNLRNIPDYLFSCSNASGEWLYGRDCEKRENYILLNNAIDTEKYSFNEQIREAVRLDFGLTDKFVIGHIGRFVELKNHRYLLEIFKKLLKENENSMLLLVGDGVMRKEIEDKAEELGIRDKVIMTGVRTDVNELLQAMDCFVFPSVYEGLPVTVIEAQASGLPCFISDTITDEVRVTELVKMMSINQNPERWAKEILKSSVNFKRYNTKQQIADSGYDIYTTAKWLLDFYLKCIEEKLQA